MTLQPIPLRTVAPAIPRIEEEKKRLVKDLTRMGCKGLLTQPRNMKDEDIVREFTEPRGNTWERTVMRDPGSWTTDLWAKVYSFPRLGISDR